MFFYSAMLKYNRNNKYKRTGNNAGERCDTNLLHLFSGILSEEAMKLKMKSKVIALAVSLTMVFTMMPMMGAQVYADDPAPAAINLVENGSAPNITGAQTSSIWFGNYDQSPDGSGTCNIEPIKWRVLDNKIDDEGDPTGELFLLSDLNLDCKKYNEEFTPVTWETSTIRTWLNGDFMNKAFSQDEQTAIKTAEVVNEDNPGAGTPGYNDTEDRIFLLSIAESKNEKYGFASHEQGTETRVAYNTFYAMDQGVDTYSGTGNWWLRSPVSNGYSAVIVDKFGAVGSNSGTSVNNENTAVRPAFNLSLESVIFTSAAEDIKYSGTVGAESLKEVGTNTTGEWKVTLKSGHDSFAVDSVTTCDGKTLNITYSGAVKGDREYISAIIKDKDGKVKYYGKLKNCTEDTDVSGTVKINVDGKLGADDTLCVFNEQLNGIRYTDFASGLIQLTIPEAVHNYRHEYVDDEYHKSTCIDCGEEITEKHTYNQGRCTVCNGACGHSSLNDSYSHDLYIHWKTCAYCGNAIEHEEHAWDAGKVTKAATEQTEGVKTFTCTVCMTTKTETIPKLTPNPTPDKQYGRDGTPVGPGASIEAAEKAITGLTSDKDIKGSRFAPLKLKSTKQGKTSMKLSWTKNKKAVKYVVYGNLCNAKGKKYKPVKIATAKGGSYNVKKIKKAKVKKGRYYKFIVVALDKNNKVVSTSKFIHVTTKGGKAGNHKSVTVKAKVNAKGKAIKKAKPLSKTVLKKGKSLKLIVKLNPAAKKLKVKKHVGLRYETTNAKVATVSGGKIKAKGKGTCYIFAYAQNGVAKAIKVTVK